MMNGYTGYTEISLSDEELARFYETGFLYKDSVLDETIPKIENHYYILKNNDQIADKIKYQNGSFKNINSGNIQTRQLGTIKPRNLEQELAFDLLKDRNCPVKLIKGVYGSGKIFATA